MKHLLYAVPTVLVYVIITFITMSPNPLEWGEVGRGVFVIMSLAGTILLYNIRNEW